MTPQQIGDAALEAAAAGAAVVHCHVRDVESGRGVRDVDLYRQVVERIRAKNSDVIINLTAGMGGDLVVETLDGIENQTITPRPQGEPAAGEPAAAPKIMPADQVIHWDRPARDLANQTRAFSPKPGAYTQLDGKRLKLFNTRATPGRGKPGVVTAMDQGRMEVGTAEGLLAVKELQIEGRRRMTVDEFLRGGHLEPGTLLG